ncbi:hypothetical protein [Nonomuraea sp. NPDC049709]|uniref:hypothetical protein n=1 Tax=Nonomuraea sp. NPDC049709 TaxID=3154736 RepID=UPI0034164D8D
MPLRGLSRTSWNDGELQPKLQPDLSQQQAAVVRSPVLVSVDSCSPIASSATRLGQSFTSIRITPITDGGDGLHFLLVQALKPDAPAFQS